MFNNWENTKLTLSNPDSINFLILSIFIAFIALTLKKRERESRDLDIIVTDQVRGVAIFFVILGHLWVHCSAVKPSIILSGDGVTIFLLLSGFGISRSIIKYKYKFKEFIKKRVTRVMIPYWIVTLIILILDYFFLKRTYKPVHIFLSLIGVNVWGLLSHFDFVRWYITFLLVWYLIAYFSFHNQNRKYFFLVPIILGIILMPLDYYVLKFGWYQFFAFPLGCIVAVNYDSINISIKNRFIVTSFLLILIVTISYKIWITDSKFRLGNCRGKS